MKSETKLHNESSHLTLERVLGDLRWLLTSPNLTNPQHDWNHWVLDEFLNQAWSRVQLQLPKEGNLNAWLNRLGGITPPTTKRLGAYFEFLVELWLSLDCDYSLLAKNVALREKISKTNAKGKPHQVVHTYGELDFIIRDHRRQKNVHLEVAVKFYLGLDAQGGRTARWYGPDLADRLDKKLNHMRWHQLGISQTEPGARLLQAQGWQIDECWGWLKGRLFSPIDTQSHDWPLAINPEKEQGMWCTLEQLEELSAFNTENPSDNRAVKHWCDEHNASELKRLPKWAWLRGCADQTTVFECQTLEYGPQMLNLKGRVLFVVPNDWVEQARAQQLNVSHYPEYAQAYYQVDREGVDPVMLKIGDEEDNDLDDCYIISAFNPKKRAGIKPLSSAENTQRHKHLISFLNQQGWRWCHARGVDCLSCPTYQEPSVAVFGISERQALHVADLFGQAALLSYKNHKATLVFT